MENCLLVVSRRRIFGRLASQDIGIMQAITESPPKGLPFK